MKALPGLAFLAFMAPVYLMGQPRHLINKSDTIRYLPYQDGRTRFSYKGKVGVVDSSGKVIVPATFSRLNRLFDGEAGFSYRYYYDGKKQGILDEQFNIVIPVGKYDDINIFSSGFFRVKEGGKYSFVDRYGKCFGRWFDDADNYYEGLAAVKVDGKWGFVDRQGNVVIENKYSEAKGFSKERLAAVKLKGKWGFIDPSGKVVIPLEYDQVNLFINNNCGVRKNGLWGYIDRSNTLFIPHQYEYAESFFCEIALVRKDGMYGYITRNNETSIPFQYSKAYSFYEHTRLASVKYRGKWIHITKEGKVEKMFWDR